MRPAAPLDAQTARPPIAPSQITPRTMTPAAAPAQETGIAEAEPHGLDPPPGAERLQFQVGKVVINGGFEERAAQDAQLAATIEGRRISVAEVYGFASELERAYAQTGYILARVALPPQRLVDGGPLELVVVDGYVESVDYGHVPERVRALVEMRMQGLVGRKSVTRDEIERALLLAGDAPGLELKSALVRGKDDGGTILALEGVHRLFAGVAGANNRQPLSFGVWGQQSFVSLNSPLGLGEQFYASSIADLSPDLKTSASRMRVFGGGAILPLDADGDFTLNPELSESWTRPRVSSSAPETVGRFRRARLTWAYRLIRTRRENLSASAALEYVRQDLFATQFDTRLYKDNYFVLRGTITEERSLSEARSVFIGGQLSRGLGGRDETAGERSGVPLSRQNAGPDFTKLTLDARDTLALAEGFVVTTELHGQTSFGSALLRSEQFSLDGANAVSSTSNGAYSVDEGLLLRVELSRVRAVSDAPVIVSLTPYLFAAAGYGVIRHATRVEASTTVAGAAGFGARASLEVPNRSEGATLALEFARQFSDTPGQSGGWRGNVSTSLRF